MLPLVEFRVLDHNAVGLGISLANLMERAGMAVSQEVLKRWTVPGHANIFCGPGNNGGDGLVAARLLVEAGWQVTVVLVGVADPGNLKTELTRTVYDQLPSMVERIFWRDGAPPEKMLKGLDKATLAIDALLGSGLLGQLREPFAAVVMLLNECGRPVVSVDIPTGLGAEPTLLPQLTITIAEAKVGMTAANSGEIVEVDIGFPDEARTRCGPGEAQLWSLPDPQAHKGDHGRVVIIGGGPYSGAPILAGLGAYRTGADLVYLLVPGNVADIARSFLPEFIVQSLPGDFLSSQHLDIIPTYLQMADAVVLGPGLGRAPATIEAVHDLFAQVAQPLVMDADALFALSGEGSLWKRRAHSLSHDIKGADNTIITPHAEELRRLGPKREPEALKAYSREVQATILAKGPIDLITDGEHIKENHTGNPRMAVGGTGDVLAGCVGALRAKGLSGYQAARLGVYLVGSAGDLALEELGWGFMASEVADRIPKALELALKV